MLNEKKIFICLTPLQMKISERIISENNIIDYKIICLFLVNNEKYKYYYEKLKKNSCDSFVYYPKDKATGLSLLKDVYVFKKMVLKSGILIGVSDIYAASIDNRYVQLIVSLLKKSNIYTFDDGLANLNYNGSYYRNEKLSKFRFYLWKMVGVSIFTQDFRERSNLHYTLYGGKKNIIDKVDYISLFSSIKKKKINNESVCNIFLGQPLYEINGKFDNFFINMVLNKMNIDMYFPHPRESYKIDGSINVVNSIEIFEDYMFNFYEENFFSKINIYTFYSTAVLNVVNHKFIDTYVIYHEDILGEDLKSIFDNFGVNFINFKEI